MISKDKKWLEDAKKVLDYNPETGVFVWKVKMGRQSAGALAGTVGHTPYIYIRVNRIPKLAHRVAFAWVHGRWPNGQIDHINGDKRDNRICNLREATSQQNMANSKRRSDNTSGFKGVRKARLPGKWWAYIYMNGKDTYLGTYDTPELAHQAYVKAAKIEFGAFAKSE
jgi:hypothetical protein